MSIIHVKDLVKRYKKSEANAVDGVSFDVEEGDFFAFLGPNGAGKTTTISILTTTLSKTSGEVTIDGHDLEKDSSSIRSKVGIIFQKPSIDLNLSAEENIRFHSILYGLYPFSPNFALMPKAYKDRVMELAEIIGIKDEIFKPVKNFSGGMKRKLEIIRSLMHNPKILFLDEPTIGLDPDSREKLWEYIQKVRKETGTTIFLTTHYMDEAEGADKVCIINKGKIVANGTPDQVKRAIADEFATFKTDNGNLAKLEDEVKQFGYKYKISGNSITIDIKDYADVKKLVNGIQTPVTEFEIQKSTLEQAYLKIVREETEEK